MGEGDRRRYTVREASELLGISQHAIRQRIRRNTLESEKSADGRVYVLLDRQYERAGEPSDKASEGTPGASGVDPVQEMLREHNQVLREQLTEAHEANREMRRLLAALTQRIPELEASSETPRAPESDEGERFGTSRQEAEDSLHEPSERRSWWRRFFGLE